MRSQNSEGCGEEREDGGKKEGGAILMPTEVLGVPEGRGMGKYYLNRHSYAVHLTISKSFIRRPRGAMARAMARAILTHRIFSYAGDHFLSRCLSFI